MCDSAYRAPKLANGFERQISRHFFPQYHLNRVLKNMEQSGTIMISFGCHEILEYFMWMFFATDLSAESPYSTVYATLGYMQH